MYQSEKYNQIMQYINESETNHSTLEYIYMGINPKSQLIVSIPLAGVPIESIKCEYTCNMLTIKIDENGIPPETKIALHELCGLEFTIYLYDGVTPQTFNYYNGMLSIEMIIKDSDVEVFKVVDIG